MRLSARFTKVSATHEGLHTFGPAAVHDRGAELHAESLKRELIKRGCEAEIVLIPFNLFTERLLDCTVMACLVDLEEVNGVKIDMVIGLKFPAYFAPHPHKVCWIFNEHRQAYDLYGMLLSDLWQTEQGRAVAAEIKRWDDSLVTQQSDLR